MRLRQGPIHAASGVQGNAAEPRWPHEGDYHLQVRYRHEIATASRTAAGSAAHPLRATDSAALCPALPKRGWPRVCPVVCC
jgi:hypothetical protein